MKTPRRMIVAALVLVALGGSPRQSEGISDKDRARALFREGNALFNRKKFEAALAKFREASGLFPSYKIDLNIGSTLYALERYDEAAEYYDAFLRKGLESAPPDIIKAAREKLDEVKTKVAAITVTASVAGARVELNAKQIGRTPLPRKVYVKPGPCQLSVTKEGYEPFLATLSLAPGEAKELEAQLKPKVEAAEPLSPATPTDPTGPSPAPKEAVDQPAPGRWKKLAGWIAVGVGGAGMITGAIFGGMAAGKKSDYEAEVRKEYGLRDPGKEESLADDFDRFKTMAVVGLVAGGVVAAAGGGLLAWYYLGDAKRHRDEHAAHVVPLFYERGAGIAAGVRF